MGIIHLRQKDLKGGAFARAAGHGQVSAALLYNAVAGSEAQSRSFTRLLGREEGLEDTSAHLRVHADTRILDDEAVLVLAPFDTNEQVSALEHGIPAVHGQAD